MRTVQQLLLALAIVASSLAIAPTTSSWPLEGEGPEPGEYLVTAGAVDPALGDNRERPTTETRTDRFDYLTYYPEHLRIHRGDTVFFRRDGFHTVTFAPTIDDVEWFFRRDEIEGISGQAGIDPSHPSCVTGSQDPPATPIETACVIDDPNETVNSGWRSMKLTFELPVGTYSYFCNIHAGMEGTLEIVSDAEPVATPVEVFEDAEAQLAIDTAAGEATMEAGQTPQVRTDGDRRIWTVKAGDHTPDGRIAIVRFLPTNLTVATGDEVEFVVKPNAIAEGHTVSFPADAYPLGILHYLNPACDSDEIDSGLPGVPLQWEALFVGCPPGTTFEWLIQPWLWQQPHRAPADLITTPATVHDSGLLSTPDNECRVSCDPWTGERHPTSSRAVFPTAGDFAYVCNVHVGMGAAIRVEG